MQELLDTPLLPNNKVKSVAIGEEYTDIIASLERLGIECFKIKKSINLDYPIACHADCRLIQLDKNTFVVDESIKDEFQYFLIGHLQEKNTIVNYLTNRADEKKIVTILSEKVNSPYPYDVKLNAKVINNNILCNSKSVSCHILDFADKYSYNILHSNQGYSSCSTVLLNNNSIITDDPSIFNACNRIEISSTILSKGQIKLNGFDYGFIGGCCGFIDKNLLAFTGKVNTLNDHNILINVLKQNKIEYIELTDNKMSDIGGIIPITESL